MKFLFQSYVTLAYMLGLALLPYSANAMDLRAGSTDSTTTLHKRGFTIEDMDNKFRQKADYHHRNAIHNGYVFARDNPEHVFNHAAHRDKWTERHAILFNSDHQGSKRLAKQYKEKGREVSFDRDLKAKARENWEFWKMRASETHGIEPLYSKHQEDLINFIMNKINYYYAIGDDAGIEKWQTRLFAAQNLTQKDAAKLMQLSSHTKALKASQKKNDWMAETTRTYPQASLESYSVPNKKSLHVKMNDDGTSPDKLEPEPYDFLDVFSNNGPHKGIREDPLNLPPAGHTFDMNRIRSKINEGPAVMHHGKWTGRKLALEYGPESAYHVWEERYAHNKEASKRWNHLHWSSIVHGNQNAGQASGSGQTSG